MQQRLGKPRSVHSQVPEIEAHGHQDVLDVNHQGSGDMPEDARGYIVRRSEPSRRKSTVCSTTIEVVDASSVRTTV